MRYVFEDYVLDDARRELRRGSEPVAVETRIFDLLTFLIRNRDRVVSQEELRSAIWDGRIVSVSTVSSSINAARVAIGDSGEAQRLIRTVPRRGFRFVGSPQEEHGAAEPADSPAIPARELIVAAAAVAAPLPVPEAQAAPRIPAGIGTARPMRATAAFAAGAGAGAGAGALAATLVILVLLPMLATSWSSHTPARQAKAFDAAVVPLVTDRTRAQLVSYSTRPGFKALAISGGSKWHVQDGAPDVESAKQSALRECAAKEKAACRLYAVGDEVVWSNDLIPMPAAGEIRLEPTGVPLVPGDIPLVGAIKQRRIADEYFKQPNSRALAIATNYLLWSHNVENRGEAVRLAVERCSYRVARPCLLVGVDDFLTVQVPRTRTMTGIFLPSREPELPDADKERIGRVYQGREWRALAHGRNGSWHAVADAVSEEAAITASINACAQADQECRLYAVGNFRVAEE